MSSRNHKDHKDSGWKFSYKRCKRVKEFSIWPLNSRVPFKVLHVQNIIFIVLQFFFLAFVKKSISHHREMLVDFSRVERVNG